MISNVKGKAMNPRTRSEGALILIFAVLFRAPLFLVPAVDAEPDIHLLSRAVAVTDV